MNISKLANAFFEYAEPIKELSGAAKWATNRFKNKHGGLWVGGKIIISNKEIVFSVNRLNLALHEKLPEVKIPINEIKSVAHEFGWFTGIVVVSYNKGDFRFRCYGAKKLSNEINNYLKKL